MPRLANIMPSVIVLLLSALVGLTIIRVIEVRMNDIAINMPTINLPQQHITVQLDGPGDGTPRAFVQKGGRQDGQICKRDIASPRSHYNSKLYHSESRAIKRPTIVVPPADSVAGTRSWPASYPVSETSDLPVVSDPDTGNYYKHPSTMTPDQQVKFRLHAKFENMTVGDYENWLSIHRDNPVHLSKLHRDNLRIINRGGRLTREDMPSRHRLPATAEGQYLKGSGAVQRPVPDASLPRASNFESQSGAPADELPLRHLDYIDPNEPMKTWILTRGDRHPDVDDP
jgi:hypothetical protein